MSARRLSESCPFAQHLEAYRPFLSAVITGLVPVISSRKAPCFFIVGFIIGMAGTGPAMTGNGAAACEGCCVVAALQISVG
jgi:hypothetical protein